MKFNIFPVMLIFSLFILAGCSLFRITDCDSSLGECEITGNNGTPEISEVLPEGYTLDSYIIEEVTDTSCNANSDCETPMEYLVMSRCPFTSICLEKKCTVVCPDIKTFEVSGKIVEIETQKDGSVLTVNDGHADFEVLVSIPNLGEEFVQHLQNIEVGKYIQVLGNKIVSNDTIIASQIYIEGTFTGEHPCNLEPDPGRCKAAKPRYYFDKDEGRCKEFLWGGCDGVVPFDSMVVCRSTCEIPDKPRLTAELCVSDGGRVAESEEDCSQDEINIGVINEDLKCCMITGGSARK